MRLISVIAISLLLPASAMARSASVKVVTANGETKNYTFWDKGDNETKFIPTENNKIRCALTFPSGEKWAELSCSPREGGKRFLRMYTRAPCGVYPAVLLVDDLPDGNKPKGDFFSIIAECSN